MPSGGGSFARRFRAFGRATLVACGLAAAATSSLAAQQSAPPAAVEIIGGMPLTDALLELERRGLKLVFSSRVVLPEMRVRSRPAGQDLRSILDELLAAHGLGVEEAPGGSLVVVSRGGPGTPVAILAGTVRSRRALTPLPGVTVKVVETGIETMTGPDGRFRIEGLEPGAYTVQARRSGFVIGESESVTVSAGAAADVSFVLQPAPLTREEVVVHPSRISVMQEQPAATLALDREEILRLPHLGGDVFRSITLLPGTTANDITAQFHVRGGRRDEVMVLLDGQELYEAYHLKDFDNALSVVAASSLASLDLTTGAFPSSYGDRMGGVLDLTTITPSAPRRFRLSVSILNAHIEGAGTLGEHGTWVASVRRGTTDLAGKLFGEEDPSFWDLFGKVDYRWSPRQAVRLNVLHSEDELDFTEDLEEEFKHFNTEYDTSYLWLTHQAVLSDRLFVDTAVSTSRVGRDRRGTENEEEKDISVRDERMLDVTGVLQSWNLQAGERHFLKAGFELRRFESEYDYESERDFVTPLAALRSEPSEGAFLYRDRFGDEFLGVWASDRIRPLDALTLELGLRYDRHTGTEEALWSPRVNLAWAVGRSSVVRVGWGRYVQSQRTYELAVEDGDTRFYPAERSQHLVAGFEHLFAGRAGGPLSLSALRAEVYRRVVTNPRPRYENLFEPFEVLPEGSLDRFRIEPDESAAEGVELFLQGRAGSRVGWFLNYAWARSEDEIGGETFPRQIDQRHTFNVDVNYRLGRQWDVNLAWRYHTGWRVTPVSVEESIGADGERELVPVLGRLNSETLPDYHRLDLRLSRKWQFRSSSLTAFLDVQNLYDRKNFAGFDLELDEDTGEIQKSAEHWPGFFASAGVTLEF
jgi:outer membrane receptor for ferrienterochelin and colicin